MDMEEGSKLRFRVGHVTVPANAAERVRRHLGDGPELASACRIEFERLVAEEDHDQLLELLDVVREHNDHHRVYSIHKLAALLLTSVTASPSQGLAWTRSFDVVPDALLPLLEDEPAEPELLNLLGMAYYELGDSETAHHLFTTVTAIEPEHATARSNLEACEHRQRPGTRVQQLPPQMTARSRAQAARAIDVSSRARVLGPATISLCMIVKDEEEMLPGCLAAVSGHVDEMIVVDTGSSDRTRQIARDHGATLIEYPWTGSFSEARNVSLDAASSEWVIYLDADEHVVDDDARHLHAIARKRWLEGVHLVETNFTGLEDMGGQTTHLALRMFRNRPEYRFEGIVHEQKLRRFPTYLPERFQTSPVRVNHYGYLKQRIEERDKRRRNLTLLLEQRASEPANAFVEFNIGSEYSAMNDWRAARAHLERALELARDDRSDWHSAQFAPLMVSRLVTARRTTGDLEGALELIAEGLGWWPDFTDIVFERALIHRDRREWDAARTDAERCLELGDAPARYVAMQGKGSHQARMLLAGILSDEGDHTAAAEELTETLRSCPDFLPIVLDLTRQLLHTKPAIDVIAEIERLLGPRPRHRAWLLVATALAEHGERAHACRVFEHVLEQAPADIAAIIGLAESALAIGDTERAVRTLQRVDPLDPMADLAARSEFLALVVAGRLDELARPLATIAASDRIPTGEKAAYTAWRARLIGEAALLPAGADAASQIMRNLEALARLTVLGADADGTISHVGVAASEAFEALEPLLAHAVPDERDRLLLLGNMYLRLQFPDMAGEQFMRCTERHGPAAETLTGLGKVATMKEMWEDAAVFLSESLQLDPAQRDAQTLLGLIRERERSGGA